MLAYAERKLAAGPLAEVAQRGVDVVAGHLRQFFTAVERTWLPVGEAVRGAARRALADLARVTAEARTEVRRVAGEIAAKAQKLLHMAEHEGERAGGRTNAEAAHEAPAEATPRGPEPEGPGGTSGRTRPTGELGGKPWGRPTRLSRNADEAETRSIIRENEAADTLAEHGYDVEQNPAPRPNGKRPDYKIEGEYFDCYSPAEGTPVENVRSTLEGKVARGQAERFVVNAKDWDGSVDALRQQVATGSNGTIKEVLVISRDGGVVHAFP